MENDVKSNATDSKVEQVTASKIEVPSIKDLLKVGIQFGHESKRWNPKMSRYIYGEKNKIHILDVNKTHEKLQEAVNFLTDAASKGNVLFVGTKRQASEIVKREAIRAGAYFIDERWAGGLLTNFGVVRKSLAKLGTLEKSFEEGVEDRTKFEVSRMKKEWQRFNRLYSGIKDLSAKPTAIVIIDTNFEKSAVRESRKVRIPIVGLVDTNSDPDKADYIIPGNDDAIGSITLVIKLLADAVLDGNKGNGIKHSLVDYSKVEIKITKKEVVKSTEELIAVPTESDQLEKSPENMAKVTSKAPRSRVKVKGILEMAKEEAKSEPAKEKKVEAKIEKKAKPVAKKAVKSKEEAKPAAKKVAKKTK